MVGPAGDQHPVTLFDDAKLIMSLQKLDFEDYTISRSPIPGVYNWPLASDPILYLSEGKSLMDDSRLVYDVFVDECGRVFESKNIVENGACYVPGGENYTIMGLERGRLYPLTVVHTRSYDYCVYPKGDRGPKYLFPLASDIEMMSSTLSLFTRDWITLASQCRGNRENGKLQSTDLAVQSVRESVSKYVIRTEKDHGITLSQVAAETNLSKQWLLTYFRSSDDYSIWTIRGGEIQYVYNPNLLLESMTENGSMRWSSFLYGNGSGKLKEKFKFSNRNQIGLVRYLQYNYCSVVRHDLIDGHQLSIRRPRRS